MYTKADIFNLALGALLLTKKIADTDNDKSSDNQTLNVHWEAAFRTALADMDLDGTSSQVNLELLSTNPNSLWDFAYKYPSDCVLLRRLQNSSLMDRRSNQIKRRTGIHEGKKVIFTNAQNAIAEYLSKDVALGSLSANAGLAVAYRLAVLSSPLIAGKGAKELRKQVQDMYLLAKAEAQELDRLENANFVDEDFMSEFVEARTE